MIIALVTFPPPARPAADPRALLEATAPAYREVPGLRRKYFVGNANTVGGIYEWCDRRSAERFYDNEWKQRITERYGVVPEIQIFDAPCLVDNVVGETIFDVGPVEPQS